MNFDQDLLIQEVKKLRDSDKETLYEILTVTISLIELASEYSDNRKLSSEQFLHDICYGYCREYRPSKTSYPAAILLALYHHLGIGFKKQ